MQGGIRAIFSQGNVLKNAVLQQVRLATPLTRPLMFSRNESTTSTAKIEEHGFESTTISDILKDKGKNADGSWLWCTTDESVYDAVKSVRKYMLCQYLQQYPRDMDLIDSTNLYISLSETFKR